MQHLLAISKHFLGQLFLLCPFSIFTLDKHKNHWILALNFYVNNNLAHTHTQTNTQAHADTPLTHTVDHNLLSHSRSHFNVKHQSLGKTAKLISISMDASDFLRFFLLFLRWSPPSLAFNYKGVCCVVLVSWHCCCCYCGISNFPLDKFYMTELWYEPWPSQVQALS